MRPSLVTLLTLVLLLPSAGCSVRAGTQSFPGSVAGPSTNGVAVDLEASYRLSDFFVLSGLFGFTNFSEETGIPAVGGDAYPSEEMTEADLTLRGQLYPIGRRKVSPYIGAGVGRFRLIQDFRRYTGTCPAAPGYTCRTYVTDDFTAASDMFREVHIGAKIGLTPNFGLVVEGRRETSKQDKGFVLDTSKLTAGIYWWGFR